MLPVIQHQTLESVLSEHFKYQETDFKWSQLLRSELYLSRYLMAFMAATGNAPCCKFMHLSYSSTCHVLI